MIYVSDLANQLLDKSRAGEFLYCPACGSEYSANKGDYWNLDKDQKLTCASEHDKTDMLLMTKSTTYTEVNTDLPDLELWANDPDLASEMILDSMM